MAHVQLNCIMSMCYHILHSGFTSFTSLLEETKRGAWVACDSNPGGGGIFSLLPIELFHLG